MRESYLEITFRHGRPLAAYYYLPRRARDRSHRTQSFAAGILVDFSRDGRRLGIEITAPTKVTLPAMNRVAREIDLEPLKRAELEPLLAALAGLNGDGNGASRHRGARSPLRGLPDPGNPIRAISSPSAGYPA